MFGKLVKFLRAARPRRPALGTFACETKAVVLHLTYAGGGDGGEQIEFGGQRNRVLDL